jgi:hypothetical protein
MKRISITLFAAIVFIAATLKASAQNEQTRQVSGFNGIASSGSFNVHVKIDGTESLKLTAGASIIKEIETVVENGKLEIRFKKPHKWDNDHYGKIEVYVTAKSLSTLAEAGSGNINVEGALSGDNAKIAVSGSGNVTAAVKSNDLHAVISGSGNIKLEGSSSNANIVISGSGGLKAKEFKTGSVSAVITGSGNVYIGADKTITAHIVGSGSLVYSGAATISDIRTVGSGRVTKANE